MSRLKFRAWDFFNKKMIDWHEPIIINTILPLCMPNDYHKDEGTGAREYKIMQFIGINDDGGFEVCEDDVVNVIHTDIDKNYRVIWCECENYPAFDLLGWEGESNGISEVFCGDYVAKVIGNIYENPELIENTQ